MLPIDVVGATPFMKGLKGRLEVHLKVNHDNNTLTLGLTAKACVNSTCIFNKPVFNRTEIPGKCLEDGHFYLQMKFDDIVYLLGVVHSGIS